MNGDASKTWPLRIVAQAADMKPRALRQCLEIGALKLSGADKKSSGSGSYIGLSRARAYQAAVMKHLNRAGLSIPHAARMALEFSDVGNIDRAAGKMFDHGKTILVVKTDGTTVKNTFSDTSFSDVSNCSACVITVDLNRVVEQVDTVLNKIS
jgi:hypothetical protein